MLYVEHRRIYSDLVLCFQLLSNGFNSQLVNTIIKSTDNRTRGHNLKIILKDVLWMPRNITLPIVLSISGTHYQAILLALQHSQHLNHDCLNMILHLICWCFLHRCNFILSYFISCICKLLYVIFIMLLWQC